MHSGGKYVHHQLPSGTRTSEAKLLIAAGAVIDLPKLLQEIADCAVGVDRLFIDPQAMIIGPDDVRAEKKLVAKIGSTGQGVGAATARRIMGRSGGAMLARDAPALAPFIRAGTPGDDLRRARARDRGGRAGGPPWCPGAAGAPVRELGVRLGGRDRASRYPVRRDARLVYGMPDCTVEAFVEVDLSTERPVVFARKIARYLALYRGGAWRTRLKLWPAVLVVTPSAVRAVSLRRTTEAVLAGTDDDARQGTEFRFTFLDHLRDAGLAGAIWQVAGRSGLHPLVDPATVAAVAG